MTQALGDLDSLLGAAALMATIVALLYSLWYPDLQRLAGTLPKPHRDDREPQLTAVRFGLRTKAVPLVIASLLQVAVFVPIDIAIVVSSIEAILGPRSAQYSSLGAAFLAVQVLAVGLLVLALSMLWRIVGLRQRLLGPDS